MRYKPLILLRPYTHYFDVNRGLIHFGYEYCGIKMYDRFGNGIISMDFNNTTQRLYINGI